MKDELNDRLRETIEKNLPKVVGEELQKRLNLVEELERKLKDSKEQLGRNVDLSKKQVEKLNKKNDDLLDKINKQFHYETLMQEFEHVKHEFEKRQRNLQIEVLQIELRESEKRAAFAESVLGIVFKPASTRREFSRDIFKTDVHNLQYDYTANQNIEKKTGENINENIKETNLDE